MSTTETIESFDSAVKALTKAVADTNRATIGDGGGFERAQPYWAACNSRFIASYAEAGNPDGFLEMFLSFYKQYRSEFLQPMVIRDEDDYQIKDSWLKVKEVLEVPGEVGPKKKRTSESLSWGSSSKTLEGLVIYFDASVAKARGTCIPISKAYLTACAHHSKLAKSDSGSPLPARLLYYLYTIMYHVCQEKDKACLKKTILAIKSLHDAMSSPDSGNGQGSTFEPLNEIMKMFAQKSGMGGGSSPSGSPSGMPDLAGAMGGLFSPEAAANIGNVVKQVTDSIHSSMGPTATDAAGNVVMPDLGKLVGKIGEALQSEGTLNVLKETMTNFQNSIPTASSVAASMGSDSSSSSLSSAGTSLELVEQEESVPMISSSTSTSTTSSTTSVSGTSTMVETHTTSSSLVTETTIPSESTELALALD